MAPVADAPMAEELEQVRQRIEHWRHTRRKQGPMPEELWDEAAALARALGVSRVARALKLGYESLQEHVRGPGEAIELAASARFVELSGVQLAGASAVGPVVEVVSGDGARLTVRLPPGALLDVGAILRAFGGAAR
jgi:hypothetical protein